MCGPAVADEARNTSSDRGDRKYAAFESPLADAQKKFEKGEIGEIELRNAFRPYVELGRHETPAIIEDRVKEWAAASPNSYAARLALGVMYRSQGTTASGQDNRSLGPPPSRERMLEKFALAEKELRASIPLTAKPYLSYFHLMLISVTLNEREKSLDLLREANKLVPDNTLVRIRYSVSLTPTWGGSFEEFAKFIVQTKAEGVPARVLTQLEARFHDNMGGSLLSRGRLGDAERNFVRALELGREAGGTFSTEFLELSRYYVCKNPDNALICS